MFVCLDCYTTFSHPKLYVDKHGLDTPRYEEHYGCPYCGGACTEALVCVCCDEYITGDYVKTADGNRYCENCYCNMELGEERN